MRRSLIGAVAIVVLWLPAHASGQCAANQHAIRFVNQCADPVWVAELGNTAAVACTQDGECSSNQFCNVPSCTTSADCPAIACTTANDCPGANPVCLGNGQCQQTCDTATNACYCDPMGAACPGGGTCSTSAPHLCTGGMCTFTTYGPSNPTSASSWQLQAPGGDNDLTLCIPKKWQGRFWGRTGCTASGNDLTCTTGQCGVPGQVQCTVSANAVTLFEPTFDSVQGPATIDFYDVSLVSGYNVPLSVASTTSPSCVVTGACTKNLNASCPNLLRVNGGACTTDADCPAAGSCQNQLCVIGCLDPCDVCNGPNPPAHLRCAKFQDYYCCEGAQAGNSCNGASVTCADDADCRNLNNGLLSATCNHATHLCEQACTSNADCPGGSCNTTLGQCSPPIIGCTSGSCPATVAPQPASICDTTIDPSGVCVSPSDCCGPLDQRWIRAARQAGGGKRRKPWTKTFKNACPTAYSYQFDDPSSTFTCTRPATGVNDYTVTFCPGS